MNRTGLIIALAIAAVVGVVFGLYPQLDLMIAAPFHDISLRGNPFGLRISSPLLLARGPGFLANAVLKEHWDRPRPIEVTQFGGTEHFVAWWDPRGECDKNCSFVSGDVAGAFWTIAPAALVPPSWRALAYGAALALGAGMAALRIMMGGHFFTDTVFAGVFTFLIIWLVHGLIYRWTRTRLTDEAVERAIERFARPGHDFIVGLLRKRKTEL